MSTRAREHFTYQCEDESFRLRGWRDVPWLILGACAFFTALALCA